MTSIGEILLIALGLIVGAVLITILYLLHKGLTINANGYFNELIEKTMNKYKFDPEDKRIFKDKWKDIV